MEPRTFVIGDIHGEEGQLDVLLARLPPLLATDTLVFLGDYLDRGPDSAKVIERVRQLPATVPARLVTLRGNHEDAWLKIIAEGWPSYVATASNGCFQTVQSFAARPERAVDDLPSKEDFKAAFSGSFFPAEVVEWMRQLALWHEDRYAIYVHAGLGMADGRWLHPAETPDSRVLVWSRDERFFREYAGKPVICGHTPTETLPPQLSTYTPEDPKDTWVHKSVVAIDTGCGKGGFLTAVELPAGRVYESRR